MPQCLKAQQSKQETNVIEQQFVTTTFIFHEKYVIYETNFNDRRRKLVVFQEGIDLNNGRYDTFEHPLYKTLFTEHKDDFYSSIFKKIQEIGLREPFNEIHMYLENKATYYI